MSSGTSTDAAGRSVPTQPLGLQPWQFFVLAALGCATAATFMARGQGITVVILLSVLMAGAAFVGLMALRLVLPLVSPEQDRTVMIGRRTRAALEREKMLTLRAIKELEFDRAMGKLSEEDFKEMGGRLRARAGSLIRQLDAGAGYRDQIERDVEKRLGEANGRLKPSDDGRSAKASAEREDDRSATALAERLCSSCATANDPDARFCKSCGQRL
jgi:hypothetical protein